jgi:hypothetical protein
MEVSGELLSPAALRPYSPDRSWVGPKAGMDAVEKTKIISAPPIYTSFIIK